MTRNGGNSHRAGSVLVIVGLGCLLRCIDGAAETVATSDLTGKQTHARNNRRNDNN